MVGITDQRGAVRPEAGEQPRPGFGLPDAQWRIFCYVLVREAWPAASLFRPVFTASRLAGLLDLDADACRRALHALTQRGVLEVDILSAGCFRLRPGPGIGSASSRIGPGRGPASAPPAPGPA
jgi:hypothetical protein